MNGTTDDRPDILQKFPDWQGFDPRGLYPPDSLTFRVNRRAVLALGGLRALLMQVAHPLVAQGVADHSYFRNKPLRRLTRTLSLVMKIVFGSREECAAALRTVQSAHQRVRGRLATAGGGFPAGQKYSAEDPQLMLWVYATLLDTSALMYEQLVAPFSEEERERYYQESRLWAQLFGIPAHLLPASFSDFQQYMEDMLNGDTLQIGPMGRELAGAILRPRITGVPTLFYSFPQLLTTGLLPEPLRQRFNLPWSPCRRRLFKLTLRALRLAVKVVPMPLQEMPQARRALHRWKRHMA